MHRVLAALGRCWRRACPDEAAGDRLLALLVGLAAVLALLPGLDGELVVDDHPIIEKGTVVRSGDPLLALRSAYWDGTKVHNRTVYRPLTILSLLAGWQLWGDNAPAFRATGIVLHALVAVLLFALLRCATARQLGVGRGAAAWAALLFAVHPIHVEAVLSAVNRSEMLAAGFGLGAALLLAGKGGAVGVGGVGGAGAVPRWLSGLLFFCALLAKEHAVCYLAVLALGARWLRQRPWQSAVPASWWVALAAYLVLRSWALGAPLVSGQTPFLINPLAHATFGERLLTAPWLAARYLALLCWAPAQLVEYSFGESKVVQSATDPSFAVGLLALVVLAAPILLCRRRDRRIAFCAASFLVLGVLYLQVLFPLGTYLAERLLYSPSAAACAIAGLLLEAARSRGGRLRVLATCLGAAAAIWLGGWSVHLALAWRNDAGVYGHAERAGSSSAIVQHNLALLDSSGRTSEQRLRRAVTIYRGYGDASANLALLLIREGRAEEALPFARAAIGKCSDAAACYRILGNVWGVLGWHEQAAKHFEVTLQLDPGDVEARRNLEVARRRMAGAAP